MVALKTVRVDTDSLSTFPVALLMRYLSEFTSTSTFPTNHSAVRMGSAVAEQTKEALSLSSTLVSFENEIISGAAR